VQRIRKGFATGEATGWRNREPGFHGLLAEALALTGAIEEGVTVLAAARVTAGLTSLWLATHEIGCPSPRSTEK
jgi:hypothetical protein